MLRPVATPTSISKDHRYRFIRQQHRIGGVSSKSTYTFFLWSPLRVAVVGCFLLACFLGTWPLSFGTRGLIPPINQAGIRIFGPTVTYLPRQEIPPLNQRTSFQEYSINEQRDFLLKYGRLCQSWTAEKKNALLERFDSLQSSPYHQIELWKYCMLYTGVGNFYYDGNNLAMLYDWNEYLDTMRDGNAASITLKLENGRLQGTEPLPILESLLYFPHPKSPVAWNMIKVLLETPISLLLSQDDLPMLLARAIESDASKSPTSWRFWSVQCQDLATDLRKNEHAIGAHSLRSKCSVPGGYCCQVMLDHENPPLLALRNPGRVNVSPHHEKMQLPYLIYQQQMQQEKVEYVADVPFISTVRLIDLKVPPATILETPNFFDILFQNDCVPTQKECHSCLQHHGNCNACQEECLCYCQVLCRIRPPPKRVVKELRVRPPVYRKDPSRLIPRIVHQTWFEAVTSSKYPNMSRLIQSWNSSGWEYRFYDDNMAADFISQHFPPQVREAYDALLPGAFKADLFRYCVLLIYGGVYADMDVLLESDLDYVVAPDVGFMTPIDEPGSKVGHRSCLWNGFLAVAPGHPIMAKVVELVVNHIRNRFTSVDYDDMLCPNPELSVSHTVDTLFTTGPCILGAALNQLMKRHDQTEFSIGTLDVWGVNVTDTTVTVTSRGTMDHKEKAQKEEEEEEEDDPRWQFPGRTIILNQNKQDMGAHRFTWLEQNVIVASTDFPDYDDRPPTLQHYSKAHENVGVYGLQRLYRDSHARANENIRVRVVVPSS